MMTARDRASMRITNVYRAYRDRFDAKETPVDVMTDMMSDLMHLADAFGSDGPSVAARAERRYLEEAGRPDRGPPGGEAPDDRRPVHGSPHSSKTASGSPR